MKVFFCLIYSSEIVVYFHKQTLKRKIIKEMHDRLIGVNLLIDLASVSHQI